MESTELLSDAFNRIDEEVREVLDGLATQTMNTQPAAGHRERANSISWLIWHLSRIQDDHLAQVAGTEQLWTQQGFAERAGLPLQNKDTGYGHSADEAASVVFDGPQLLSEYHHAVHHTTQQFIAGLSSADLDRVVDTRWNPPVTLGVRLVSVLSDCSQHVGQAAYVKGLLRG
ncbi:DUF664 domain-containing protein [Psychromicrobium sp. YIM B11713]|uniref:mycothiol transferase n=1 Tax=Psychromicrobium sp. YIM B11713 TaxID=3145233 RepID=UPI00374E9DB9